MAKYNGDTIRGMEVYGPEWHLAKGEWVFRFMVRSTYVDLFVSEAELNKTETFSVDRLVDVAVEIFRKADEDDQ